ncbi:MAG: hypothetical protein ACRDV0_04700 [Acidimicrobiales bacterium]
MAPHPPPLGRSATGPLQGVALTLYVVLLPYIVETRWTASGHAGDRVVVRVLLVALAAFWLLFVLRVVRDVVRLRRGQRVGPGGSAWLATILVAALPFLIAPHDSVLRVATPAVATMRDHHPRAMIAGAPDSAVALALMARRRVDELKRADPDDELDDSQVDAAIDQLRAGDPRVVDALRRRCVGLAGLIRVTGPEPAPPATNDAGPVVVCVVGDGDDPMVAYAREGGRLRVPLTWDAHDVEAAAVGLHDGGRLTFTRTEGELVRALATRSLHRALVVHVGPAGSIDDELAACAVTLTPMVDVTAHSSAGRAPTPVDRPAAVRVELLRADPRVVGLAEPFVSTLRRRCIEMAAYLALHRHEPVTGERLRARVLAHSDVDASSRTLANTASALRRSLGVDERGPRLHPVTSAGLYVTHGLASDVERFFDLVARARGLAPSDAAPLLEAALGSVRGEPLSSALRGFEWFLAEGVAARLARDGEWAALALARHALDVGDVEEAYWALRQGRLIDPFSDALAAELARVPRLREFGGDRSGRTQDRPVGARGAVAVGGSLAGLGDEVVE